MCQEDIMRRAVFGKKELEKKSNGRYDDGGQIRVSGKGRRDRNKNGRNCYRKDKGGCRKHMDSRSICQ